MALGDPFSTIYEGSSKAYGSLGESILGIAGLYAKQKQAERQMQMEKQKNKTELLATLATKGIFPQGTGEEFELEGVGKFKKPKQFNFAEVVDILNKNQGAGNPLGITGGSFDPTTGEAKLTIGETAESKLEQEKKKEIIKGVSGEVGGRVALAKEGIKNIQDIRKILFPTGEAKSFKRTTAFASNLPGGTLPLLPQRGWGKAEQEVFRKMGAALSGRQLIQTGVAARPEETARLIAQFAPSLGSNPEAAFNALTELEDFYKSYIQQTDPEARFGKPQEKSISAIKEGQTATNPKTGEVIIFRGGKWQKI